MKIVVAEKVSPATLAVLQAEPEFTVVTADELPSEQSGGLAAALREADGLIVRSAVQVTDALLENATHLRVIGRAGVGVDNIDSDAATRRGIVVMNTPGANAIAVVELTVGMMIALARQLPKANSPVCTLPTRTMPASARRRSTEAVAVAGVPASAFEPANVG